MSNQTLPKVDYYYLTAIHQTEVRSTVNLAELQRDIKRGVKTLSEHSYCKYYGITRTSLAFYLAIRNLLGEEMCNAKKAEMVYRKNTYIMRVTTFSGFTIVFQGLGSGFFGEGPRGTRDLLKALGFSEKQMQRPFESENFTVSKRK